MYIYYLTSHVMTECTVLVNGDTDSFLPWVGYFDWFIYTLSHSTDHADELIIRGFSPGSSVMYPLRTCVIKIRNLLITLFTHTNAYIHTHSHSFTNTLRRTDTHTHIYIQTPSDKTQG